MNPDKKRYLPAVLRSFAFVCAASTIAACGAGGTGGAGSVPAVPADAGNAPIGSAPIGNEPAGTIQPSAAPSQAPTSSPQSIVAINGSTITVTGKVVAVKSGGFQIQGGSGLGYIWIYTTSSTAFSGAKPYVGENIEATGSGSASTSIRASQVKQLGSTSSTATAGSRTYAGKVVAVRTGSFQIQGGSGVGYVWIYTSSGTSYSGAKPYVGESVSVSATGSLSTKLVAVSVSQSGTSTSAATPAPVTASAPTSPSSGNQAHYAGCGIYPADDVYNKSVASAAVDPYSSTIIGGLPATRWWMALPANERANIATNATHVETVRDSYGRTFSVPWSSGFYIEPGDAHAIVLNKDTCQGILSYGTSQSSGVVRFTAARPADYTKPFVPWSADGGGAMASGLDTFAGAIKDSDIASGAIRHVLNMSFPTGRGVSQYGYVYPAGLPTRLACSGNCSHPLHYGDHLRLKASYTCPSAASYPQANMICVALKTYGAFYADQASYMELYFLQSSNGASPYNASDISHFNPSISQFEVLREPQIKCYSSASSCT